MLNLWVLLKIVMKSLKLLQHKYDQLCLSVCENPYWNCNVRPIDYIVEANQSTVWPDWAKIWHLAFLNLGTFLNFHLNKQFQNIIFILILIFKSSLMQLFWAFNSSFDILATFPKIGRMFSIFWSLWKRTICNNWHGEGYKVHILGCLYLLV